MNYFLKLYVLTLLIQLNVADVKLITNNVLTQIGGSYTVMLVDDDENIKPKECYLSDNRITYEINLTTSGVPLKPINSTPPVEENTNILTSLGYGICGFKLNNLGNNYIQRWNISYVDEINENFYSAIAKISANEGKIELKNSTQYVPIGDKFTVSCEDYLNKIIKCELYNPQGVLMIVDSGSDPYCFYNIETIKMSDYGAWKCIFRLQNNMSPLKVYNNILEKENLMVNLWKNETNTHIKIGCLNNNISNVNTDSFCEMIRPDGEIFVLKDGFATDRYTTLSTNIRKGICGMEIQKPLIEFEKGLWRCEFNEWNRNISGGFINLSNDSSSLPPPEIQKDIYTRVDQSFSISCRVPYSSSYCYIRGPNIKIYPVEDNQGPTVGLCNFVKKQATLKDNGTWFCGFAKKTGEPDSLYSFNVKVSENFNVQPEKENIESTIGDTVHLKCSTEGLGDYSLQYCRFKSPRGEMYNINPDETSDRINYYGRGLKYGDCGIELKNIQLIDSGIWTCITRIGSNFNHPEVDSNIYLVVHNNFI